MQDDSDGRPPTIKETQAKSNFQEANDFLEDEPNKKGIDSVYWKPEEFSFSLSYSRRKEDEQSEKEPS